MDYIRHQRASEGHDPNTHHCLYGADGVCVRVCVCAHVHACVHMHAYMQYACMCVCNERACIQLYRVLTNTISLLLVCLADLIMLGLATHEPNFTIIREEFKQSKPRPCEICNQEGHSMNDCTGAAREKRGEVRM